MFTPKLPSNSGNLTTPGRSRSLYERKSNAYTPKGKSSVTGMLGWVVVGSLVYLKTVATVPLLLLVGNNALNFNQVKTPEHERG